MTSISFITLYAVEQFKKYPKVELQTTQTIRLNGKVENQSLVNIDWTVEDLLEDGFIKVAETNQLSLYLKQSILNIAIVDHRTDYIWFGYYPKYEEKNYTSSVRQLIESGVTIDYANAVTLNEARTSLSSPDAGTLIDYTYLDDGFHASIDMVRLGISFELNVQIMQDELIVHIPYQSIVEVPFQTAAMRFPRELKLLSVMVFPYLGSNNFEINAYAFVPDGSGALIRYEDVPYNSAYIRRIYGRDLGIQTPITSQAHLKTEPPVSLPIFGINHGYQQAAFLAEAKSGFGAMELHAYPYQFNNLDINRTFFMYRTRDKSLIRLSEGDASTITIINKDIYPHDYEVSYAFLSGEEASYAGMANRYRSHLGLDEKLEETEIDMHLEVIGLDMKPSLIGQSMVKFTTYQDVIDMTTELLEDVSRLHVTYRSYNHKGFFGSDSNQFRAAIQLGGARGLEKLTSFVHDQEKLSLSLYHDPLVTPEPGTFQTTLRKTTLDTFYTSIRSSRIDQAYLMTVTGVSDRILRNLTNFEKHQITSLSLESVGQLNFSYQLGQNTVYREKMINQLIEEIEALNVYDLGLYQPNAYLFKEIDRYFDMMNQSNLYSFMTDSVPFISLVLSGYVKLYTSQLNFVNDLDLMALKMIEYNLRPAFIATKEPGYMLRHTNYEYLFTTEFDLWKPTMINQYQKVGLYLNQVIDASMIGHRFITDDVVEVMYDNNITIYINYGNQTFMHDSFDVLPMSAYVHEVTS
jgi:hypothetical protein